MNNVSERDPSLEVRISASGSDLVVFGLMPRAGFKYDVVAGYLSTAVLRSAAVLLRELADVIESGQWESVTLETVPTDTDPNTVDEEVPPW